MKPTTFAATSLLATFVALLGACSSATPQPSEPSGPPYGPIDPPCTMEAKVCPDGSAVGRSGPRCEFAACPGDPPKDATPPGTPVAPPPEGKATSSCGNGTCEDVTCQAVGCPAPETKETCPQDCK